MRILCSISTRGRYDTTLPLAIQSVISQTLPPNKLIIFDDNENPIDLRTIQHYQYLFAMLQEKNIKWEVIFGAKKGQHHNHQIANKLGYEWVWRLDDDNIAEPNVLETLYSYVTPNLGAVGGSVLTPPFTLFKDEPTGKIHNIDIEPNIQWNPIKNIKKVDHLHCSFLYRAGVCDYNLSLSPRAFREETLFTYGFVQKKYINLVVPNAITWHLKNNTGGIRSNIKEYSKI